MSRYFKWAQKEHPFGRRVAATLPAGVVFAILFPFAVIRFGPALDRQLGLPRLDLGVANYLLGFALLVIGLSFAFWSIHAQLTRGRGTPLPLMPTQELLTQGPFRYCRNPMTFGTILAYLSIGVLAGTIAGIGLVLLFGALLVTYLKTMEERELSERFGEAYLAYKRKVPFMIPRPPKRR